MSTEERQQMNKNQINRNHSDGIIETCESISKKEMEVDADSVNYRLEKVFHPDSEGLFERSDNRFYCQEQSGVWHKTIQEVDALFDSEKKIL